MNSPPPTFSFPLLWTVGFCGKRYLPPGSEERVTTALDRAMAFLIQKAADQDSKLTAVSSIARGADVLFAQACLKPQVNLPWKCALPFPLDPFLEYDLANAPDASGKAVPLSEDERSRLRTLALDCLAKARPRTPLVLDSLSTFDIKNDEMRDTAYQECGYRIVDESDVMISVLRNKELADVVQAVTERQELDRKRREAWAQGKELDPEERDKALRDQIACPKGGSVAITLYAYAAKHPCILLDAEAADPWAARVVLNDPEKRESPERWFCDPDVTPVLREALAAAPPTKPEICPCDSSEPHVRRHAGPDTPDRRRIWTLMGYLGQFAGSSQKSTQRGLGRMLLLHVFATGLAATLATGLGLSHEGFIHWQHACWGLVIAIAFLATLKPVLAYWASRIEHRLEHKHQRENWLHARVLSETCRGMWALWQLPEQPLDAADEEDFPKLKRLLRTLRLMRELDAAAPTQTGQLRSFEIASEAAMRLGAENYIRLRLHDQSRYYGRARAAAALLLKNNMALFHGALWGTIIIGSIVALHKWAAALGEGNPACPPEVTSHDAPWADPYQWMELLVIMGPFLATYALARITILDCRRRARRYDEMQWFLLRLADTLRDCTSNSSRLRLIEHAERMMIEEQHEWFSTTRNFSV